MTTAPALGRARSAISAAAECIRAFEAEEDILRFSIDGWCSWAVLRFDAIRELARLPQDEIPAAAAPPVSRRLARAVADATGCIRKGDVFAKTYPSARCELVDGRSQDVFFDAIIEHVGSGIKVESACWTEGTPPLIPPTATTYGLGVLSDRLARHRPVREAVAQSQELRLALARGGIAWSADTIASRLSGFSWAQRLFGAWLDRARPKAVFIADSEHPLVAAAKRRGIPVVELQHGMIHPDSEQYCWSNYAAPYRDRLPLPDLFLTHGNYWSAALRATGFWDRELHVVGSTRVDAYRARVEKDPSTANVVLTTQGIATTSLIAFVREATRQLENGPATRFWIRLHPIFDRRRDEWVEAFRGQPNVAVLSGDDRPGTFELLARADLHLSIYSSCHYEALGLGVPTVVLPFFGHELVSDLYERGHGHFVRTPNDLADLIRRARSLGVPEHVRTAYYAPGAHERLLAFVDDLLARPGHGQAA